MSPTSTQVLLSRIFIGFVCLILSSCFDSREEIWVNADASGKARVTVTIPAIATSFHGGKDGVAETLKNYVSSSSVFSSYRVDATDTAEGIQFDVHVTFDDVMALSELSDASSKSELPANSEDFMGKTDVEIKGLAVHFKRSVDISSAIPGSGLFPSSQLEGHAITTIIHLPKKAKNHNATSTSDEGKTLTWRTPVAIALSSPINNQFTMPLPIPWGKVTLIVVAMGAILVWILTKARGK